MVSPPLSQAKLQTLRIVPRITAALSVLGSTFILASIVQTSLSSRRGRKNNNHPRASRLAGVVGNSLLVGMSVADLLSSSSYVIGSIAFPESFGGHGNQATCNAQAFLVHFQVAAALYSGFLAWRHCLSIRFHWNTQRMRIFEYVAHVCSWMFVVITGSTAIAMNKIKPHWIRCYIDGPGTDAFMWTFFFAPIWASILMGSIAMWLIYRRVRYIEARSSRYRFPSSDDLNPSLSNFRLEVGNAPATGASVVQQQMTVELPMTRRVVHQALGYAAAFIFVYVFPTTSRILSTVGRTPPYAIRILAVSFVGSQGFLIVSYISYYQNIWIGPMRLAPHKQAAIRTANKYIPTARVLSRR